MDYRRTSWLLRLGCLVGLLGACAGKLDKPERFSAAVKAYEHGGAGSGGSPAASPNASSVMDASTDASVRDAGPVETPACVLQLFKTTCGAVGCHAKGSLQIDLVSAGVADRLIDQTSDSQLCRGRTYVSTDGSASLLSQKLSKSPPCGVQMPQGAKLSAKDAQCLSGWIDSLSAGAADDSDAGAGR